MTTGEMLDPGSSGRVMMTRELWIRVSSGQVKAGELLDRQSLYQGMMEGELLVWGSLGQLRMIGELPGWRSPGWSVMVRGYLWR